MTDYTDAIMLRRQLIQMYERYAWETRPRSWEQVTRGLCIGMLAYNVLMMGINIALLRPFSIALNLFGVVCWSYSSRVIRSTRHLRAKWHAEWIERAVEERGELRRMLAMFN